MRQKINVCLLLALLTAWYCSSANGMDSEETDDLVSTWYGYLNPGQMPTVADIEQYYKSYGYYPTLTDEQSRRIISPLKIMNNQQDLYLADGKGMTLYVFDKDKEAGKSACYGSCAKLWPPYVAEASHVDPALPLTVITRDDGMKQTVFKGKPLYYYAKDSRPGDAKGEGVGKAWWIVKP